VNTTNRLPVEVNSGGDLPRLEQPMRKFLAKAPECQASVFWRPCLTTASRAPRLLAPNISYLKDFISRTR